jgi:hypothetical protein
MRLDLVDNRKNPAPIPAGVTNENESVIWVWHRKPPGDAAFAPHFSSATCDRRASAPMSATYAAVDVRKSRRNWEAANSSPDPKNVNVDPVPDWRRRSTDILKQFNNY